MTCPSCGHDGLPPLVCEHCGHRWYATPAPLDEGRLARVMAGYSRTFSDGSWLLLFDDKGYPSPSIGTFAAAIAAAYAEEAPDEGNEWQERNE